MQRGLFGAVVLLALTGCGTTDDDASSSESQVRGTSFEWRKGRTVKSCVQR